MPDTEGTLEYLGLRFRENDAWTPEEPPRTFTEDFLQHIDGVAVYHLEYTTHGDSGPHEADHHKIQPFHEGPHQEINGVPIWSWDGDRDNPTLNPSYGWWQEDNGWRVHLFLRNGTVDPCGDMILEVT